MSSFDLSEVDETEKYTLFRAQTDKTEETHDLITPVILKSDMSIIRSTKKKSSLKKLSSTVQEGSSVGKKQVRFNLPAEDPLEDHIPPKEGNTSKKVNLEHSEQDNLIFFDDESIEEVNLEEFYRKEQKHEASSKDITEDDTVEDASYSYYTESSASSFDTDANSILVNKQPKSLYSLYKHLNNNTESMASPTKLPRKRGIAFNEKTTWYFYDPPTYFDGEMSKKEQDIYFRTKLNLECSHKTEIDIEHRVIYDEESYHRDSTGFIQQNLEGFKSSSHVRSRKENKKRFKAGVNSVIKKLNIRQDIAGVINLVMDKILSGLSRLSIAQACDVKACYEEHREKLELYLTNYVCFYLYSIAFEIKSDDDRKYKVHNCFAAPYISVKYIDKLLDAYTNLIDDLEQENYSVGAEDIEEVAFGETSKVREREERRFLDSFQATDEVLSRLSGKVLLRYLEYEGEELSFLDILFGKEIDQSAMYSGTVPIKLSSLPPDIRHDRTYLANIVESNILLFLKEPRRCYFQAKAMYAARYILLRNSGLSTAMINNNLELACHLQTKIVPKSIERVINETQKWYSRLLKQGRCCEPTEQRVLARKEEQLFQLFKISEGNYTIQRKQNNSSSSMASCVPFSPLSSMESRKKDSIVNNEFSLCLNPIVRADLHFSKTSSDKKPLGDRGSKGCLLLTLISLNNERMVKICLKNGISPNIRASVGNCESLSWGISRDMPSSSAILSLSSVRSVFSRSTKSFIKSIAFKKPKINRFYSSDELNINNEECDSLISKRSKVTPLQRAIECFLYSLETGGNEECDFNSIYKLLLGQGAKFSKANNFIISAYDFLKDLLLLDTPLVSEPEKVTEMDTFSLKSIENNVFKEHYAHILRYLFEENTTGRQSLERRLRALTTTTITLNRNSWRLATEMRPKTDEKISILALFFKEALRRADYQGFLDVMDVLQPDLKSAVVSNLKHLLLLKLKKCTPLSLNVSFYLLNLVSVSKVYESLEDSTILTIIHVIGKYVANNNAAHYDRNLKFGFDSFLRRGETKDFLLRKVRHKNRKSKKAFFLNLSLTCLRLGCFNWFQPFFDIVMKNELDKAKSSKSISRKRNKDEQYDADYDYIQRQYLKNYELLEILQDLFFNRHITHFILPLLAYVDSKFKDFLAFGKKLVDSFVNETLVGNNFLVCKYSTDFVALKLIDYGLRPKLKYFRQNIIKTLSTPYYIVCEYSSLQDNIIDLSKLRLLSESINRVFDFNALNMTNENRIDDFKDNLEFLSTLFCYCEDGIELANDAGARQWYEGYLYFCSRIEEYQLDNARNKEEYDEFQELNNSFNGFILNIKNICLDNTIFCMEFESGNDLPKTEEKGLKHTAEYILKICDLVVESVDDPFDDFNDEDSF